MAYKITDKQGNPARFKGRTNILGMDCLEPEIKEYRPSDRTLLMVASQETPDRMKDIVMQDGIDKKNWRKNPVILFSHKYDSLPIGRGVEDFVEKKNGIKRTMIRVQFSTDPEADRIFKLMGENFLKGGSIGFINKKSEDIKDEKKDEKDLFVHIPQRFLETELLEYSICSIPAHADALVTVQGLVNRGLLPAEILSSQYRNPQEIEIQGYEGRPGAVQALIKIMTRLELRRLLEQDKILELDGLEMSARDIRAMVRQAISTELGSFEMPRDVDKGDLRQMINESLRSKMGMLSD